MKTLLFVFSFILHLSCWSFCGTFHHGDGQAYGKADRLAIDLTEGNKENFWNDETKLTLTYCVSDGFRKLKPQMVEAMRIATADWEAVANVKFIYQPEYDDQCSYWKQKTLFRVVKGNRRWPYRGLAFFPGAEKKKRQVKINERLFSGHEGTFLGVVRHELGHVLGFRHEHARDENVSDCPKEQRPLKGITDYDPMSVMHYSHCKGIGPRENLSDLDKIGATMIYP